MNDKKNKLVFPVNCSPAQDYFSGFGQKELLILMVSAGIALVVMIVFWKTYGEVIALIASFSIVSVTFVITRRNPQQESLVDQIMQIYRYHRAQKQFEYEYHDEFEV